MGNRKETKVELTSEKVNEVFLDCLFLEEELKENAIEVKGIVHKFSFHPERIKLHKETITALLMELPETFQKNVGAGWSFLNACNTKDQKQWTDLHQDMEALFVLGIAIDKVEYVLPRHLWKALPGGMPYLVIV